MISQKQYRTFYDSDKKIWFGLKESLLYDRNVSVGRVILNSLNSAPNNICQISHDTGVEITNKEQRQKTIRAAIHLNKCGINHGDVIGIIARNSEHLSSIVFASLTIGAPINPLDAKFISRDIAHIYNLTKPKIIFCDYDILDKVNEALDQINLKPMIVTILNKVNGYKFIEEFFTNSDEEDTFIAPSFDNENSIGLISCSSGTTGRSKGVILSHALILAQVSNMVECNQDDIFTSFSSLYWISGSGTLISNAITGTTRIITKETFSPQAFFDVVKKHKLTYCMTNATEIGLIVSSSNFKDVNLSSIRRWACGGSLVPEEFRIKINKKLINGNSTFHCYGMTEVGGIATVNPCSKNLISVGFLSPNVQAKITGDDGEKLGPLKTGEICLKSRFIFMGYAGMPEILKDIKDEEGFVHSGDMGYFDSENYLFISGRKKEIIKCNGNHVSPAELENSIMQLDGITFACVVPIPDKIAINYPAAVIIRKENSKITEKEIFNHVAKNLGPYKELIGGVYFVDSFPMTLSGKIKRTEVAEIAYNLYKNRNSITNG